MLPTMRIDMIEKYDRRVPRYTSYPTAPHFHAGVDGATYRAWLAALPDDTVASLYVHVPFCDTMCWFCGCHTRITRRYAPVSRYLDVLDDKIDRVAETIGRLLPVTHIHWGGGTPTMLSPADIARVTGRLRRRFAVRPEAEFAVEIDPRGLERETVAALAEAGVTRASLGVQDVNDAVQRAVNRVQPLAVTRAVTDWLRAAGIKGINIDLMYGLPHQTVTGVRHTVDCVLDLDPDRIALFGYAHVPWMKRHQRLIDEAALPDGEERARQFEAAAARLAEAGYVWIGLDHFARPDDPIVTALEAGRLKRNFQGYTTDDAPVLLGFGASAIGALPQGYVQNAAALPVYRQAIEGGGLATARGIAPTPEDRLRRAVIERLMCDRRVDLAAVCRVHRRGPETLSDARPRLAAMVADGLIAIDGDRIEVLTAGYPLVRAVCAAFDQYLAPGETRHARAV